MDIVGNTPLLALDRIAAEVPGLTLLGKAEFLNPSGSVKDRPARAMILEGVDRGALTPDKTIIDATSGNTGIAYAMLGAALGFGVRLYMPANTSLERKSLMRNFGALIVETDPLEGSDGAYLAARAEADAHPERYFYPDQYNNPANPLAHYNSTAPEIWEQSAKRVTHFISVMGTSGTFMGVSRRLKEFNPGLRAVVVQPDSPFHGIEGTKHLQSTIQPGIFDGSLVDETVTVSTEEAYAMTRRLTREEGICAGISSGANVRAALTLAQKLPPASVVVTMLCDSGSRYLSEALWRET
jgi:cysteine synthase B